MQATHGVIESGSPPSRQKSIHPRDSVVDAVRGLAIFIMLGGNMAPLLAEPHSFSFRLYSSFAAPLFILIAGMMVGRTQILRLEGKGIHYYIKRMGFLFMMGAAVDVLAWNIMPFMTADVLYLMGIMMPVCYYAAHWRSSRLVWCILCIFLLTPVVHAIFGYTPYATEITLSGIERSIGTRTSVLQHWLIDGWFPLFPWAGFMLAGILIARKRWHAGGQKPRLAPKVWRWGWLFTLSGILYMHRFPGLQYTRLGFSELFYSPDIGIMLVMLGGSILLLTFVDRTRKCVGWRVLQCLGEVSMAMYVLHILLIGRLFPLMFSRMDAQEFIIVYGCFFLWLLCVAWTIKLFKSSFLHAYPHARWLGIIPFNK